jgi:hypothetical protein
MEIFNKHIFGSDADYFKQLSVIEQVNWIKKHTNQQNDDLINEFLSNIPENNDKNCINCGNNFSKAVPTEATTDNEPIDVGAVSGKDNIKRPKNAKRRKD